MMDTAINWSENFENRLIAMIAGVRVSNIEQIMSKTFEDLPKNTAVKYLGEMNKTDLMF